MTETPLPPEPDDRTALYWPENAEAYGGIVMRDDQVAALREDPEHHWFCPGDDDWTDWPTLVRLLAADGFHLSAAIVLRPVGAP